MKTPLFFFFLCIWAFAKAQTPPTQMPLETKAQYTASEISKQVAMTGHNFYDYLRRLGLNESDVFSSKGQKWLSVGEGKSNFVAEAAKRGVNSFALDAIVKNPHAPERTTLGLAQKMPYPDQEFERVVSVWLMDYFFDPKSFNDPQTGKEAIQEMIRVTKVGGDIRISPVQQGGVFPVLDALKEKGTISYEVLPYYKGEFHTEAKKRLFKVEPLEDRTPGSIRITRLR